jgi:hypothetical protein
MQGQPSITCITKPFVIRAPCQSKSHSVRDPG